VSTRSSPTESLPLVVAEEVRHEMFSARGRSMHSPVSDSDRNTDSTCSLVNSVFSDADVAKKSMLSLSSVSPPSNTEAIENGILLLSTDLNNKDFQIKAVLDELKTQRDSILPLFGSSFIAR
jgi:hypothetical protein